MTTLADTRRCGTPHRIGLRRALSAVLRRRASIKHAAWLYRVPREELCALLREGRMPW